MHLGIPTGVHVLCEREGRLLLMRRAGTGFFDGLYSLPGGHVEPGESIRMAARRELREGWDNPFSSGVSLDDRISLVVRMDRVMYQCKIVRRGAKELGVKFTAPPKPLAKATREPGSPAEKTGSPVRK